MIYIYIADQLFSQKHGSYLPTEEQFCLPFFVAWILKILKQVSLLSFFKLFQQHLLQSQTISEQIIEFQYYYNCHVRRERI